MGSSIKIFRFSKVHMGMGKGGHVNKATDLTLVFLHHLLTPLIGASTARLVELRVGGPLVGVHVDVSCRETHSGWMIMRNNLIFPQYWDWSFIGYKFFFQDNNNMHQKKLYQPFLYIHFDFFASFLRANCSKRLPPVGNLPPKKILKSSSGEMSASKSRWKFLWNPGRLWPCCWAALDGADRSPYWSYCCLLSGLLRTAYALPMAVGGGRKH